MDRIYKDRAEVSLTTDEIKAIKTTARLVFNQSDIAIDMVLPLMLKMATHTRRSGTGSRDHWLASLKALSELCATLHKMVSTK